MGDEEKIPVKTSLLNCCSYHWRGKVTFLLPILASPILIYAIINNSKEFKCVYLVIIMSFFWITECIPLYMTSVLPVVFLPVFGILDSNKVCSLYFTDTLVMFIGTLIVASAVEYSNLHTRIALFVINLVGCSPRRLLFGLILVSGCLSMWLSNSATTAMLCPIVKAILTEMDSQKVFGVYMTQEEEPVEQGDPPHPSYIAMSFYFGVAFASSIGGCGSLIGSGTNLTFKGLYDTRFPDAKETLNFPNFSAYTLPIVVTANLLLLFLSLLVTHMGLFRPNSAVSQQVKQATINEQMASGLLRDHYNALGRINCHEIQVAVVFGTMVLLLFTRKPGFTAGWSDFLNAKKIGISSPAMLGVAAAFALPTQYTFFKYCCGKAPFPGRAMNACLSWVFVRTNVSWGLCFLLGGGFAISEGSKASGMARMLGDSLLFIKNFNHFFIVGFTIIISIFCTAFSSNVAVCNILSPIFFEMAVAVGLHPLMLAPHMLALSLAFLLPVSTPPNAIACGYSNIKSKYLAFAGILPTFWAIVTLWFNGVTWGYVIFPNTRTMPDWAKAKE